MPSNTRLSSAGAELLFRRMDPVLPAGVKDKLARSDSVVCRLASGLDSMYTCCRGELLAMFVSEKALGGLSVDNLDETFSSERDRRRRNEVAMELSDANENNFVAFARAIFSCFFNFAVAHDHVTTHINTHAQTY